MADKYFAVPQGKVYIASRDSTGVTSGFSYIGDCDGFNISTSQTFVDIYESNTGNRGIVAHIPSQTDWAADVSILNIDGNNLARAFYGDTTTIASGTVTGEAIVGYNGQMSPLKYPGVSSVVVKKGGTALTLGTDYTVDAVNGTITILAGSTQVPAGAGVALTVDYSQSGVASRIRSFTQGIKDYTLRFEGKSKFDDLVQIGVIHRISLDMAATLSLIGTGVNKLAIKGKVLPDPTQAAGESQYFTYVQK